MAGTSWALWAALSAAAVAASMWHYVRRETPGRGRQVLAALRAAALAVLLLLLFDPELPARGAGPARATQVLLDASLSMNMPTTDGTTRWSRGVELARARAGGRAVLLYGDGARAVQPASLPAEAPGDARSRLLPALQAAAEAGAGRVLVITDGSIEDADAVARWLPRLGLDVSFEAVGDVVTNRSLAEATAPGWAQAGEPVRLDFAVAAAGEAADDSVRVVARRGVRVIGRTTVAPPGPGRLAAGSMELRLDAPDGGGWVPVVVELEGDDAVPDDDERTVYVHVSEEPAGIVLVSLRPDWEPRFLAPVLEQAVGLPLRGFLRGATGQYVRLGAGLDAGTAAAEADVQRAISRAALVVLHGVGADAPAWAVQALGAARHLLVFPAADADAAVGLPLPVEVGAEAAGDFFPSAEIPPSPLAPLLAGQEVTGAAPLTGLRPATAPAGAWSPLLVARGRQGTPQPAVLAGEGAGRRWAVALGSGYWQWSFRGGEERQLYTRLWSALAGWLVRERGVAGPDPVRPARLTAPRGQPLAWIAHGAAADSVAVQLVAGDGAIAADTVVTITAGDSAFTAPVAPGDYTWRARAFTADDVVAAEGALTVEGFSPEFARPAVDLAALRAQPTAVRGAEARAAGTPLHATPFAYVLIVLLLATEWILRRRWGLR